MEMEGELEKEAREVQVGQRSERVVGEGLSGK